MTLIAITKTFPASDVRLLAGLGVLDIGENRDQEAAPKAAECAGLEPPLRWHFVGQLQANKAKSVVGYADVIHSVDRSRLVDVLGARARAIGRDVTCLIQVDLDQAHDPAGDESGSAGLAQRGGAVPSEVPALAEAICAEEGLDARRRDGGGAAWRTAQAGISQARRSGRHCQKSASGRNDDFCRHDG